MRQSLLLFLILLGIHANAQKLYLWNMDNIQAVKSDDQYSNIRKNVIKKADKYVSLPPYKITDRKKKFAPDAHYFENIGPYWWPDPKNPQAPWINKDGIVNPDSKLYDDIVMGNMATSLKYFSIAYYITNDRKYYDAAIKQLNVWFLDKETYMYPNLEYGQVLPGHNNNHGRSTGLISMYDIFLQTTESIRLLELTTHLPDDMYKELQKWMSDFLDWCLASKIGMDANKGIANTGLAYHVTKLNLAVFAGRNDIIKTQTNDFKKLRLDTQIASDGSMPEELKRTKSFGYSIYNLTHIVDFCVIQENLGNRYYRKNKKLIDSAFGFLISFVGNKDVWQYEQIDDWSSCETKLIRQINRLKRLKPRKNEIYKLEKFNQEINNINIILD